MRKFLLIIFCRFYGFVKDDTSAIGLITVLLSFNVISIIGYYRVLVEKDKRITTSKIYEIIIIVIIGFFCNYFILRGKKAEDVSFNSFYFIYTILHRYFAGLFCHYDPLANPDQQRNNPL